MQGLRQILDIPRALRETLEKGKAEYAEVVRRTRWAEGPIYICACGASAQVALVGAYAFEFLLCRPVVLRTALVFQNYSFSLLEPRSLLLVISASGDDPEVAELARLAHSRHATLLALTSNPAGLLAKSAQGVFLTQAASPEDTPATVASQHLALTYLAWMAAETLKRPSPQLTSCGEEFEKLPTHADWACIHLADAIRALTSELRSQQGLWVVGTGFYHGVALQCARRFRELVRVRAAGTEVSEFARGSWPKGPSEEAVLFLSGSRSKLKKAVHESAAKARTAGIRVFSITDPNDRELSERSDLAVLTPSLLEVTHSTLILMLAEWLAVEAARQNEQDQRSSSRNTRSTVE